MLKSRSSKLTQIALAAAVALLINVNNVFAMQHDSDMHQGSHTASKDLSKSTNLSINNDEFWLHLRQDRSLFFSQIPPNIAVSIQRYVHAQKLFEKYKKQLEKLKDNHENSEKLNDLYYLCSHSYNRYFRERIPAVLKDVSVNEKTKYIVGNYVKLFYAVATGNLPKVQKKLQKIDQTSLDKIRLQTFMPYSLLDFAVIMGYPEIVDTLCKKVTQNRDLSPIANAVSRRFGDVIEVLIKNGFTMELTNTNPDNIHQRAPLSRAIHNHDEEIALSLLQAGAPWDYANENGISHLMHACQEALPLVVQDLLKRGANKTINQLAIAKEDEYFSPRRTALDYAIMSRNRTAAKRATIVRTLLEHGAIVPKKSLLLAAQVCSRKLNYPDDAAIFTMLIDRGSDPNAPSRKDNRTPIFFAARHGRTDLVELLVSRGANVDHVDANGKKVNDKGKLVDK